MFTSVLNNSGILYSLLFSTLILACSVAYAAAGATSFQKGLLIFPIIQYGNLYPNKIILCISKYLGRCSHPSCWLFDLFSHDFLMHH